MVKGLTIFSVTTLLIQVSCVMILPGIGAANQSNLENLPSAFWSIQFENDFFTQTGDRHYTHGTKISCVMPGEGPEWLETMGDLVPIYSKSDEKAFQFTLAQTIFTPEDIQTETLIGADRPYTGYLYAGFMLLSRFGINEFMGWGNILEFTIGIVGPASLAAGTQILFHEQIGADQPNGWDNQLHNEPALGVTYSRIWGIVLPLSEKLEIGTAPQLTCSLGNVFTYAGGGVIFRLGHNIKSDVSPPNIQPGFPGFPFFGRDCKKSWYFYAGTESRLVAHNIFLDGNTFTDSHRVDRELIVGDFQFGFVFHYGNLRFALSNMVRSKEFNGQNDSTQYGAINISWFY